VSGYDELRRVRLDHGQYWPSNPNSFIRLAKDATVRSSCLINCYEPGARLSLHQDMNKRDISKRIVSVSLGIPAVFLFGDRIERTNGAACNWQTAMRWFEAGRPDFATTA
jgi:alkylated DNA repair protein (DNA oxidative demethylase)